MGTVLKIIFSYNYSNIKDELEILRGLIETSYMVGTVSISNEPDADDIEQFLISQIEQLSDFSGCESSDYQIQQGKLEFAEEMLDQFYKVSQ